MPSPTAETRRYFTRETYSPVRVSTLTTSPSSTNSGTRTTAPVSSFAGFTPPWAVSPRTPGSVSTIFSSTKFGGETRSGVPFHSVTWQVSCSLSHCSASPTASLPAANCSYVSGTVKCQNSPSVYRYWRSWSTTSAASTESPDLHVLSTTRPVSRLGILTRLNACPLPGLTNSFSTITHGSLSIRIFRPERNSLVL